ncbi:MAG TPA: FCD domain-containing protein, partial [Chitinophaga sp.]
LKDLNEVRQLLEMKIAEKAAQHRTPEDITRMRACLDQCRQAVESGNTAAAIDADIAFHTAIAAAARNEILSDLYRAVSIHLKKGFTTLYSDTSSFRRSHDFHEQLLEAIIAGNRKQAWDMVMKIIDHVDR